MHRFLSGLLAICFLGQSACTATTEDTHFLKNVEILKKENSVTGLSVDAKQRFVWSLKRGKSNDRVICAEPSPDTSSQLASAIAVQAQLQAKTVKFDATADLQFEKSISEALTALGDRTEAIQLLRDGLYRTCESYANNGIDDFGYTLVLTNIDNIMLKLVALGALAGNAVPDTQEGKKLVAATDSAKIILDQTEADFKIAREEELRARNAEKNARNKADNANRLVAGLEQRKVRLEAELADDKNRLVAAKNLDAATVPDRDAQIKTLETAVDTKTADAIILDGEIAAGKTDAISANTNLQNAITEKGKREDLLAEAKSKRDEARGHLADAKKASAGVTKQLTAGAADAIYKIATESSGLGSLAAACLAWTSKQNNKNENGVQAHSRVNYCRKIMTAAIAIAAKEANVEIPTTSAANQ